MKKRYQLWLMTALVVLLMSGRLTAASAPHVIGLVQVLSDHSAQVTLRWSDGSKSDPIRITSWSILDGGTLVVSYQSSPDELTGWNSRRIDSSGDTFPMRLQLKQAAGSEAEFSDLPAAVETADSILNLYYQGIINGYGDGTFKPQGEVTRAEFAKMILLGAGYDTLAGAAVGFPDVAPTHWAKGYIRTLADKEILRGRPDGRFDPEGKVTLGEVLAVLNRTFILYGGRGNYPYALADHWSNPDFLLMVDAGIVQSTDVFYKGYAPNKNASRETCALLMSRILEQLHEIQ